MIILDDTLPTKTLVAGPVQFSYMERGKGAALVLLHGLGSAARSWKHQLAGLSDSYHVIAWDAPGYGRSTGLEAEAPEPGDYAKSLNVFVDRLGLRKFHLVGQSLGAIMATRYAAEHPERILSLTLTSPASGDAGLTEEERTQRRDGLLNELDELGTRGLAEKRGARLVSPDASGEMRTWAIETMAQMRADGYRKAVHMRAVGDTRADLARLRASVRVQFILGEADEVTAPESIRRLATARPDATVHAVPGAGHAIYLERPVDFNALLREFLATP